MKKTRTSVLVVVAALVASTASAQTVDARPKWKSVTIVHYKAIGEFSGPTTVVTGLKRAVNGTGTVTDRVEVEFDWNQKEMKLVGTPVFRTDGPMGGAGYIQLSVKRDYAAGSVCHPTDEGRAMGREAAPARSETADETFMVPMAMLLEVPGSGGLGRTPDGKSIIIKSNSKPASWNWTYTPTPVR